MEDIKCDLCKKEFKRKKSQVLLAKRHYCSVYCQNLGKRKGMIITCFICKKNVYKKNRDLINSKNKKYFCSYKCSNYWLGSNNREQNHPNWTNGRYSYKDILKRTNRSKICKLCGEKDIRILIVHHVDQNRRNNIVKNLVWLCQDCHFLVHHYRDELDKFNNKIKEYGNK